MKLSQISVFLENRKGRLFEVAKLLGQSSINIRALSVAESESFGILRIVVDRPEDAVAVLKDNGFTAKITDIVAVEVDDKPGGLAEILRIVGDSGLNVEYMYAFVEKNSDKALMVFKFDEPDKAINILTTNGINIAQNVN